MRIKNGEQEEDDLQLIDGAIACHDVIPWKPIKDRITGKCGIVDMFVVAVMLDTDMLLKFKVGNDVVRYRTFKAKQHGCASRRIKLDFASFVMKVTWSTI
nr:unnamed protein product [Digitaria exilis]